MRRALSTVVPAFLLLSACHPAVGDERSVDIWGPWRSASRPSVETYATDSVPPLVTPIGAAADAASFPASRNALPVKVDLAAFPLSEMEGVELMFRFRVTKTPAAKLDASQSLAKFELKGKNTSRGFYLHAYSRGSGFCLNGIASAAVGSHGEKLLMRGAADPQTSPRWDTQWHTVRIAWCRSQFAASWDGLPVLRVVGENIDYSQLTLGAADPGDAFGTLEMTPFEARRARFASPPVKENLRGSP